MESEPSWNLGPHYRLCTSLNNGISEDTVIDLDPLYPHCIHYNVTKDAGAQALAGLAKSWRFSVLVTWVGTGGGKSLLESLQSTEENWYQWYHVWTTGGFELAKTEDVYTTWWGLSEWLRVGRWWHDSHCRNFCKWGYKFERARSWG